MKTVRLNLRWIVGFCLVAIVLISGCNKEPQEIGLDLVGNNPLLVTFNDTSTVRAFSIREDSLRTDESALSMLGSMYDPVFGKTTGSIYTQLSLSTLGQDFGTNPVCDSMKLFLLYNGYYGDTLTEQTVKIYEVTEEMMVDTSYYSDQNLSFDPTLLADYSFIPHPTDTVWIDSASFDAHLIVPMTNALGEKILAAPAEALDDNDEFKKYINGIYITTDPVVTPDKGAMLYMNFYSTLSRINIYYHNDEEDSLFYRMVLNSTANARFGNYNHYEFTDASPEFRQQVVDGDTTLGDQFIYTQGMAGVKTKISFPYIMDWVKDHNIALNEVKLIYSVAEQEGTFGPPSQLSLIQILEDGSVDYLQDQIEGTDYFGGFYENGKYTFRITRYIQSLLTGGDSQYGLYFLTTGGSQNASRSIIYGGDNDAGRIRLEMIYTVPN